jgi:hypothetical protein
MRFSISGGALVSLLLAVTVLGQRGSDEPGGLQRSYSYSGAGDVVILSFSSHGGMELDRTTYQLYGDGRLVHTYGNPDEPVAEVYLDRTEVENLMRIAIEGGLMDWDREALNERIKQAVGGLSSMTDLPRKTLKINLEHYDNGSSRSAPLSKHISFGWEPMLVKGFAPNAEIREVDALIELRNRIEGPCKKGA